MKSWRTATKHLSNFGDSHRKIPGSIPVEKNIFFGAKLLVNIVLQHQIVLLYKPYEKVFHRAKAQQNRFSYGHPNHFLTQLKIEWNFLLAIKCSIGNFPCHFSM